MVDILPYSQSRFGFIAPVCISLLAVTALAQDVDNKLRDRNYVEVTRWASEVIGSGGRIDEKLGEFETYNEAEKRSSEWSKSHPKDLRLTRERKVTVRIYPERPSKPQPDTPIPNAIKKPDFPFVDIPPSKRGSQGKNANSISGKSARGKVGEWDLSFKFQEDGSFVATDPSANGKVLAKGDWSQTGTAVSIQTENYLYMGTVSGDKIEGKRVTRSQGSRTVESWKIELTQKAKPDVKPINPPVLPKVNERWSDEKGDYVFVLSDKRYPGHGRIVEFIYKGYSDEKRWEIDEKGNLAFSNPVGSTHYTIRQVGDQIFIFDGYGDKRISAIHKVLKGP